MIVILNLYRNAVVVDEMSLRDFIGRNWNTCKTINRDPKAYQGRFFPVTRESMDFDTDLITLFDGSSSTNTINVDIFLN